MTQLVSVLGAGLVGSAMINYLLECGYQVLASDRSPSALQRLGSHSALKTITGNLLQEEFLGSLCKDADLVISAVPGALGFEVCKQVIQTGTNLVDIAFFPQRAFDLDQQARHHGVVAVVDCGVSPGLSNIMIGEAVSELDQTFEIEIFVGGLPRTPEGPLGYKVVFSPGDLIEEYLRPARVIEGGALVHKPAVSETKTIRFDDVGELEGFNSDGLRSLLETTPAREMHEWTLRYPGHIGLMKNLRELGFFSQEVVPCAGSEIRPFDMAVAVLSESCKLEQGEEDLTALLVTVTGLRGSTQLTYRYHLLDRFDSVRGVSSMARTTGYTATAVSELLLSGGFCEVGVHAPERIGQNPDAVAFVREKLKARGITYIKEIVQ